MRKKREGVGIDRKEKDAHQGHVTEKVTSVGNQSLSLLGTLGASVEYALQAGAREPGNILHIPSVLS